MKNQKSNDERINGKLNVSIYAHPTDACPDRNDPTTAKSAVVVGLDAARAWLDANGGYASLKADYSGVWISGWSVYSTRSATHRMRSLHRLVRASGQRLTNNRAKCENNPCAYATACVWCLQLSEGQ